jgi:glycosyltransferase involved in cell wall biosynthesis
MLASALIFAALPPPVAGVVVLPRNPSALAGAIEGLLSSPTKRQALSRIAIERVCSVYSEPAFVSSYLKILNLK